MKHSIRRVAAFVVLVTSVLAATACKKGVGQDCMLNKECGANMVCLGVPGPGAKCIEIDKADAACAATKMCKTVGHCGMKPVSPDAFAMCLATTDAQCAASEYCKTLGQCKLGPNGCVK